METLCKKIVSKLLYLSNMSYTKDDLEVYIYGFYSIIYTIMPTFVLILISLLNKNLFEMCFWILSFLTIRKYAGGIHAATAKQCFLFSILLGISTLLICPFINISLIPYSIYIAINVAVLIILAPVTHKEFSRQTILLCKAKLCAYTILFTIVTFLITPLQSYYLHALLSITILCIAQKLQK